MAIYAGKHGRVKIGDVGDLPAACHNYKARMWEVSTTAETIDITNFETNGDAGNDIQFAEYIGGFIEGDVRFEGFLDIDSNPFNGLANVTVTIGETYVLRVYPDRKHAAALNYHFPVATILDARFSGEVRGTVRCDIHAKNKGIFYLADLNG